MTETIAVPSPPENSQPPEASSAEPPPQNTRSRAKRFLNGFLAAMVSIYGILTAVTVLTASRAEGLYYDNVFIAQAHLNDASELAIETHLQVLHDFDVLEQIRVHELSDSAPEIIEFLYGQLSTEGQSSLEHSGEIDETYAEEMYFYHNAERELANTSFEYAVAWSQRAGTYEALATVLAVGLAFSAWASLMEGVGPTRWLFTIVAAFILVASICFMIVQFVTQQPLEQYITL